MDPATRARLLARRKPKPEVRSFSRPMRAMPPVTPYAQTPFETTVSRANVTVNGVPLVSVEVRVYWPASGHLRHRITGKWLRPMRGPYRVVVEGRAVACEYDGRFEWPAWNCEAWPFSRDEWDGIAAMRGPCVER